MLILQSYSNIKQSRLFLRRSYRNPELLQRFCPFKSRSEMVLDSLAGGQVDLSLTSMKNCSWTESNSCTAYNRDLLHLTDLNNMSQADLRSGQCLTQCHRQLRSHESSSSKEHHLVTACNTSCLVTLYPVSWITTKTTGSRHNTRHSTGAVTLQ